MAKTKKKPAKAGKKSFTQMNAKERAAHVAKVAGEAEKWAKVNECIKDVFKATGGLARINELFSSGYLLQSLGNSFYEEAYLVMQRYGLKGGQLTKMFEKAQMANNQFFDAFYGLICDSNEEDLEKVKKGVMKDYDKLYKAFYRAFRKDRSETWEPTMSIPEQIHAIEQKYGIKITIKDCD